MAAISKISEGRPAIVLANPVYVISHTSEHVEFEILEADAAALRQLVGTPQLLAMDGIPLWGQLLSLVCCSSTAPGLGMLRERQALRGVLRVYLGESQLMH